MYSGIATVECMNACLWCMFLGPSLFVPSQQQQLLRLRRCRRGTLHLHPGAPAPVAPAAGYTRPRARCASAPPPVYAVRSSDAKAKDTCWIVSPTKASFTTCLDLKRF